MGKACALSFFPLIWTRPGLDLHCTLHRKPDANEYLDAHGGKRQVRISSSGDEARLLSDGIELSDSRS